jgi:hypothetical protein
MVEISMRKTMFALLVAGSVILPLGSVTASAGPASFLGSNLHVARTGNSVSTVNYYRRYGYDWCCGPRYYSNYYYAPRGYGYYLPPAVYYPPPVVYYAPPVRYYAPPVVYEPYDDVYFDRPLRRRYYGGW